MPHYIICGFSGVGKTSAEQKHNNVFDFESSTFSHDWKPLMGVVSPNKRNDFPKNYIDALIEHMRQHHNCVYLLSCHKEVRDELKARDFEYIIVMPTIHQRNEYMKRWLRRGSSAEFIRSMYDRWDEMIRSCEEDPAPKIYLFGNEYIKDVLPT
jgi:hypothetical protein